MPASSQLLKRAIQLSKAGNKQDARALLRAVIQREPGNELAWLWYVNTWAGDQERFAAIEQWLRISPDSQRAQGALNSIRARQERYQRKARTQPTGAATVRPKPLTFHTLLNRQISVYTAFIVVVAMLLCVLGGTAYLAANNPLTDRYDQLRGEHGALVQAYTDLVRDRATLLDQHQALERDHSSLSSQHNTLTQNYDRLVTDFETLSGQHSHLTKEHNALVVEYDGLTQAYDGLVVEHDTLKSKSITPPYIYVHDRTVSIAFVKQDNSGVTWDVPFESLERDITRGHKDRASVLGNVFSTLELEADAGETYSVTDYRRFIDQNVFSKVMADLYEQADSDDAFISEVWHIVAQLTSYSEEIQDTPRYPLETFLAGGGDCEDTSILFASMIKAAPVDWKVDLVYMDSLNPTAPAEVNHVIVCIDTGQGQYLVETTNKHNMQPYDNVVGWYMEID